MLGNADVASSARGTAPAAALVFGLGGLIPFLALAGLASFGPPSYRQDAMQTLAHYGATILSFVGALHWGYAVRDNVQGKPAWWRFGWSVLPALVAWIALRFDVAIGLRAQASMLVVCVLVDRSLAPSLHLPSWLLSLRYTLTAVATVCLLLASQP